MNSPTSMGYSAMLGSSNTAVLTQADSLVGLGLPFQVSMTHYMDYMSRASESAP